MTRQTGFTLAEVLVATLVLSIALVAVATGFQLGASGIEVGKGETAAAFLAEQRLEELKALALADWTNAALAAGTTPEGYGAITGAPTFRRTVSITDSPGGTTSAKLLQVSVFYRPVTGRGMLDQEREVTAVALVAARS
ncbi:MAG: hypothetical protein A3D33_03650 [Candidatus Rokubacteria bacterium RIFCSPHIGHO2_02_FULL_73_26]|nr:MAG: hypothetical protein A3D33_03650 [Candidatus Rokubacteria bacterium RIFCSPHIGHO2_02_FULL_73_26]